MLLNFVKIIALLYLCVACDAGSDPIERNPKKRQIYREQVLPHAGGKIPDTAFETDRLFLNRLQKEGIALPDGIVPEQRNPQVYPNYAKPMRTVFHIALSSDARYTVPEGRYRYSKVPTVETTYLYPQSVGHPHIPTPPTYSLPVYRQFQLHNPQLNQVKFQPKKTPQNFWDVTPTTLGKSHSNTLRTESYQNFNILNVPLLPLERPKPAAVGKVYINSYGSSHLFNEFDDLFNKFDLHQTPPNYY